MSGACGAQPLVSLADDGRGHRVHAVHRVHAAPARSARAGVFRHGRGASWRCADDAINHAWLITQRISPTLLRAANMTPLQLKAHGTCTVGRARPRSASRRLHLLDEEWCEDAVAAYGAPALLDEFLATSNDAVVLAGSPAVEQAGHQPGPAAAALRQPAGRRARGAGALPPRCAACRPRRCSRRGCAHPTSWRWESPRRAYARTPSPRTRSCCC